MELLAHLILIGVLKDLKFQFFGQEITLYSYCLLFSNVILDLLALIYLSNIFTNFFDKISPKS